MTIIKYDLSGFYNLRDGGGLPAGNSRIKTLCLLRSDQPASLDAQDVGFLQDLPLAAVIDLRTEAEVSMEPSPFKKAGFKTERHAIVAGSPMSLLEGKMTVASMYHSMIKEGGRAFAEAIKAVAAGLEDGAVIVHCTAGKDRTGVTIALVQSLLGVPRQEIVRSYALTEDNLKGAWLESKMELVTHFMGAKEAEKVKPLMAGSPPEALESALDFINSEFGGPLNYLTSHGLDEDVVQRLSDLLLEDITN